MSVNDIDLFELNETFASVVLLFRRVMGLDPEKLNANGGAIAMGHPLGATGAMMLGTLVDELERAGRGTGLALAGAGSGLGTATLVERI
jgi:acetyl-CoA C-acetyltransferase